MTTLDFGLWSVIVPEHVTTRKPQRRIYASDRQSGLRSKYGLYPARFNLLMGKGWAEGLSSRGVGWRERQGGSMGLVLL